jgi:anti-sigma regulatory factor (Ser/Thr protein kinase)
MIPVRIAVPAVTANLAGVRARVLGEAAGFGLSAQRQADLDLILEEAFVNICDYAYGTETGPVTVVCRGEGECFVVELTDCGTPFDPLSLPDPDTTLPLEKRAPGGLGWLFIRRLVDDLTYRREGACNILTLSLCRCRAGITHHAQIG